MLVAGSASTAKSRIVEMAREGVASGLRMSILHLLTRIVSLRGVGASRLGFIQ